MIQNQKIKFAKDVIFQEINALKKLSKSYNSNFIKAIDLIQKCKGKVICVGMGKSGHIIRKISATLSSVGIPSIYLHPSEAAHGDLGA
jgi:arabinose-5-phosphate isomerase